MNFSDLTARSILQWPRLYYQGSFSQRFYEVCKRSISNGNFFINPSRLEIRLIATFEQLAKTLKLPRKSNTKFEHEL